MSLNNVVTYVCAQCRAQMLYGFVALFCLSWTTAFASEVLIGDPASDDLSLWQRKSFAGETQYAIVSEAGRKAIRAQARASASGLYRELKIDLIETPFLNWSWRIQNVLKDINERSKAGDDFAARVYVVVSGGALFWKTRSLVYVWSSHQPIGQSWPNPYTTNARHIAIRSGPQQQDRWLQEKRNVRADFKQVFGDDIRQIDAIAIMTDTDNSGQHALAWYGPIRFTAQ